MKDFLHNPARILFCAFICTFSCVLAACAPSGPDLRYYVLASPMPSATTPADDGPRLGVVPVTVPGYLERTQIVTREPDGVGIHVDDFARWGEELSRGVSRLLCESLSAHGRPAVGLRAGTRAKERLVVEILRFDGAFASTAVLDAVWTLQDRGKVLASGHTVLEETVGESRESLILAQSKLVFELGAEIAKALPRPNAQGSAS